MGEVPPAESRCLFGAERADPCGVGLLAADARRGFADELSEGVQLARAVHGRMRSEDLLDERGARTRHADNEHRGRIGAGREQVRRLGLIRHRVDHAPGEPLRLARVPGAVRVEGASQPPLDAGRPRVGPLAARCSTLSFPAHAAVRSASGTGRQMPVANDWGRPWPWG